MTARKPAPIVSLPDFPKLLSTFEVSRLTNLSRSTIGRAVADGSFPPPIKTGRRSIAWRQADVLAWIESRPLGKGHR